MRSITVRYGTTGCLEMYKGSHNDFAKDMFNELKTLEGQLVKINGSKKVLFRINEVNGVTITITPTDIPFPVRSSILNEVFDDTCVICINGVWK